MGRVGAEHIISARGQVNLQSSSVRVAGWPAGQQPAGRSGRALAGPWPDGAVAGPVAGPWPGWPVAGLAGGRPGLVAGGRGRWPETKKSIVEFEYSGLDGQVHQ